MIQGVIKRNEANKKATQDHCEGIAKANEVCDPSHIEDYYIGAWGSEGIKGFFEGSSH